MKLLISFFKNATYTLKCNLKYICILHLPCIFFALKAQENSCKNQDVPVKKISTGSYLSDAHEFYYNEEALYTIDNDTFFIRSAIEYDNSGILSGVTFYKSEGSLTYTKNDILNDWSLMFFLNIKSELYDWKYINDHIITNKVDTIRINKVKAKNGESFLLSKEEQKVTIFKLLY